MKRFLFYIVFFVIGLTNTLAQELKVRDFREETTNLQARTQRKDSRGVECALLKVQLPVAGAEFKASYKIGEAEFNVNQYLVYMAEGAKSIEINVPNCLPLKVEFSEASNGVIKQLQSKTVYTLVLEVPAVATAVSEMKYVSFKVNPSNAVLTIDNLELKSHSEPTPLLYSQHTYSVTAPYYKTKQGTFVISKDMKDEPITITMEKEICSLSVTSTPSNSDVFLDGKKVGVTPYNQNVEAGIHEVVIQKSGYQKETIKVDLKDSNPVSINKELSGIIAVKLSTNPDGAGIIIDNQVQRNVTPMTYNCPPGKYQLTFYKKGYLDLKKQVEIDGAKTEYSFNLKKQYFKKSGGYVDASFLFGNLMGIGVGLGCYIYGVNAEIDYIWGVSKSEHIFWNTISNFNSSGKPSSYTYSPSIIKAKIGYGFVFGNRFRLTPQIGMAITNLKGKVVEKAETNGPDNTFVSSATFGARLQIAIASAFSVSLIPEYSLSIKEGSAFTSIASVSSKVKKWGNGANVAIATTIFF